MQACGAQTLWRAFSVTSHDDVGDPDAMLSSICFSSAGCARLSFQGVFGWVRVCARVYLKRTAVSDLHFWRTELPAWRLSVRRECSEGKLLKNKGFKDDISDHLCVFVVIEFRQNCFGRGSLIPVIGLSL